MNGEFTSVSRTANVGTVGKNWLRKRNGGQKWVKGSFFEVHVMDLELKYDLYYLDHHNDKLVKALVEIYIYVR